MACGSSSRPAGQSLDDQTCAVSKPAPCSHTDCSCETIQNNHLIFLEFINIHSAVPFKLRRKRTQKNQPHKYCKVAKYKEQKLLLVLATFKRKEYRAKVALAPLIKRCEGGTLGRVGLFLKFRTPGVLM